MALRLTKDRSANGKLPLSFTELRGTIMDGQGYMLGKQGDAVKDAEFLGRFYQAADRFEKHEAQKRESYRAAEARGRAEEEEAMAHQLSILGPALARVAEIEGYSCVGGRYELDDLYNTFLEKTGRLVAQQSLLKDWQVDIAASLGLGILFSLAGLWVAGVALALGGSLFSIACRKDWPVLGLSCGAIVIGVCLVGGTLSYMHGGAAWGLYQAIGWLVGAGTWLPASGKVEKYLREHAVKYSEIKANKRVVRVLRAKFDIAARRIGAVSG